MSQQQTGLFAGRSQVAVARSCQACRLFVVHPGQGDAAIDQRRFGQSRIYPVGIVIITDVCDPVSTKLADMFCDHPGARRATEK